MIPLICNYLDKLNCGDKNQNSGCPEINWDGA